MAWMQEMRDKGLVVDELFPVQWPAFWESISDKTFNQMTSDIDTVCGAYHPENGFPPDFDSEAFYQDILALVNPPAELLMPPSMMLDTHTPYAALEPVFA